MDLEALWTKALKQTEVIRARAEELHTFQPTVLPYVFLAESNLNLGDTIVRQGQVVVERPALLLPTPHFEGFDFERELQLQEDAVINFLLVRGVRFPSMKYAHQLSSLDVMEQSLAKTVELFTDRLQRAEDIRTGLVIGPEEAWQFSVLILVASLLVRSAPGDLQRLFDEWRKRQRP